ncbi:CBS domain-containing protein [Sphingomonas yunnanensis]|uniref:CBS domain-containing protein n=1 Tax=Sphingomonas yunnanensis TaxID=310400 RepID=UPI001CA79532|nr:CBS domain-containing protein [Sphingomonas yunnanensis]MBY9065133.1 CBS domain-containing protein [Sphingomonas yunnanensis]
MTIAAILRGKGAALVTVSPETTVAGAIALLAEHRIGALPVVTDGVVRGIFSERDVVRLLAGSDSDVLQARVQDVMTAPALSAAPGDAVLAALSLMTQRRIRHLPVVEDGELRGIVSIGDLVKFRIERIEAEAAAMRDYIQQV